MEDRGPNEDVDSIHDTNDDGRRYAEHEQIKGRSGQGQPDMGSGKESMLDMEDIAFVNLDYNDVACLVSDEASRILPNCDAGKDSDKERPVLIRPKLVADLHFGSPSLMRPNVSKNAVIHSDKRTLFGTQGERYKQEVRQHQIQQWVLKHNFSQESLPSDCWPDKYPQALYESPRSHQNLDNGKPGEAGPSKEVLQEPTRTKSLFSDPRQTSSMEFNKRKPYCISAGSGIINASGLTTIKKRKTGLMDVLHKPQVRDNLHARNVDARCDTTLRQWLSRPSRVVDHSECLHIFKQILKLVDIAHAQGVVMSSIRPSSFLLSSMHRVSFLDCVASRFMVDAPKIEASVVAHPDTEETQSLKEGIDALKCTSQNAISMSNACTKKAWDKLEFEEWLTGPEIQLQNDGSSSSRDASEHKSGSKEALETNKQEGSAPDEDFLDPLLICTMEERWYMSPEELSGGACSFASNIYCLGVLLFELFCSSNTLEEYCEIMQDLRHRIMPSRMLIDRPKEAAFCLWLLHPNPHSRPKTSELLHSEIINEDNEALSDRQAAMHMEELEGETNLLLDFLQRVQKEKQDLSTRLVNNLSCLTSDIKEVERRRALLKHRGILCNGPQDKEAMASKPIEHGGSSQLHYIRAYDGKTSEASVHGFDGSIQKMLETDKESWQKQEDLRSKCARLMSNFDQLQQVYFSMRWKVPPSQTSSTSCLGSQNQDNASASTATNLSNVDLGRQNISPDDGASMQESDSLGCFFDSLCKYARYSKFEVKAIVRHGDLLNTANMVCSLAFDRDQEYFATAGVCKRIKIFECDAVLNGNIDIHYPVIEMANRSMLSSICWNSYIKSHIASSDYDGIVQLWDATTGQSLMQYEEHEKRAWSVDFSQADPTKLASGSDDGTVKIWSINQGSSIGTIKINANVCCIQFPREYGHLIAFGSADYKIYCYDLRNIRFPWCLLAGHKKAVSYVKFFNANTLVSASTDNTLKLWDLSQTTSTTRIPRTSLLSYTGHTNEKNFVGLAVMDGYIACGSETNAVFAYHKSLPMPMATHKFGSVDPISGQEFEDDTGQFVSSVCWRGKSETLLAANSMGNIKVLEMV